MTKKDLYGKEYSRDDFVFFWKKNDSLYSFLSQWYAVSFVIDDIRYNCAEQYVMAQKATMFGDSDILRKIMASDNPAIMNQFGRQVRNTGSVCTGIMERSQSPRFHPDGDP